MSSEKKGGGQEGALGKIFERQRMQQAAVDAAKKLEDATKEAEETARVAEAQAAPEEAQVLSGFVGPLPGSACCSVHMYSPIADRLKPAWCVCVSVLVCVCVCVCRLYVFVRICICIF